MTAIVMECIKAERHPNADSLNVYVFKNGTLELDIVANHTNVYSVGSLAVIATVGSVLLDGTIIEPAKIRGASSFGMALCKTDLPVGTDVSELHCQTIDDSKVRFISWPDIGSLFNVRKDLQAQECLKEVVYRAKIKLDGTNAGVHVRTDGTVHAQSRSKLINTSDDNMGFARFVEENKDYFKSLACEKNIVIFGEWCGTGIQKNVAISNIGKKIFAIFAIQVLDERKTLITEPEEIKIFISHHERVHVLPWASEEIKLNYADPEVLKGDIEIINSMVAQAEKCDPWVKENFGVEGVGEGFVLYPVLETDRTSFSELVFKAKGEEHKVVKTKQAVQIDPEVANSITEFVALFVTDARLNQIAGKVGPFEQKSTGQFVKEFSLDVVKESKAELEASNLTWDQVGRDVSKAASSWWTKKCKEI